MELIQLLVMPLPTATSAVPPGFNSDRSISESHLLEMCYRLKTMLYLSGGLTSALLSQNRAEHMHLTRASIKTVSTLTNSLKTLTCFTLEKNYDLMTRQGTVSGRQRRGNGAVVDKSDVRAALELGPPLIATMIQFEEKLHRFRNRQRSFEMDSWDFVEEGAVDIDPPVEEQIKVLISCQEEMSTLAGILIARAMIAGGGEASTLVWRAIIASFDSTTADSNPVPIFGDDGIEKPSFTKVLKEGRSSLRTNLLCRLISIVIDLILNRREDRKNPWTSIELCSAIARLCDLVEEKNLLSIESSTGISQEISSLDQVRLLYSMLNIMESGKENTGWCQLVLPRPPTRQSSIEQNISHSEMFSFTNPKDYCEGLIIALTSDESFVTVKTADVQLLAENDEIYDVTANIASNYKLKMPNATATAIDVASSKLLLPILQPTLRIILSSLHRVKGVAVLIHQTRDTEHKKATDSLLSVVVEELGQSLTAAIVGLAFSNARDICLNTLSLLRKCVELKERGQDGVAALMYRTVFLTVMNEMRIRYEGERSKRKAAELQAYDDIHSTQSAAAKEAANASQVEALLLGDSLTGGSFEIESKIDPRAFTDQSQGDDFIVFPTYGAKSPISSPRGKATLGWNNYKGKFIFMQALNPADIPIQANSIVLRHLTTGFGRSLEECCKEHGESLDVKDVSDSAFQLLSKYLDAWDERQLIDDEESELVELFDTKSSLDNRYDGTLQINVVSHASAADSMTSFIGELNISHRRYRFIFKMNVLTQQLFSRTGICGS